MSVFTRSVRSAIVHTSPPTMVSPMRMLESSVMRSNYMRSGTSPWRTSTTKGDDSKHGSYRGPMLASTWAHDLLAIVTAVGFDIALPLVITTPPSDYHGADARVSPLGPACHDAAVVVPRRSRQEGLHRIGNLLECSVMNQPDWHLLEA